MISKLPERLKNLRERKGVPAYIISQLCGLNDRQISKYERGVQTPSVATLIELSDYFDVSIDYLVGVSNDPRRK